MFMLARELVRDPHDFGHVTVVALDAFGLYVPVISLAHGMIVYICRIRRIVASPRRRKMMTIRAKRGRACNRLSRLHVILMRRNWAVLGSRGAIVVFDPDRPGLRPKDRPIVMKCRTVAVYRRQRAGVTSEIDGRMAPDNES